MLAVIFSAILLLGFNLFAQLADAEDVVHLSQNPSRKVGTGTRGIVAQLACLLSQACYLLPCMRLSLF